jgi:hypothetical protein
MEKLCCTCGAMLPKDKFNPRRGSCRECEHKKYRQKKSDACACGRLKMINSKLCFQCEQTKNTYDPKFQKLCGSCGETKSAEMFGWRLKNGVKRIRSQCKACEASKAVALRQSAGLEALRERKRKCEQRAKEKEQKCEAYKLKRRRSAIRVSCKTLGLKDHERICGLYTLETRCQICDQPQDERGRLHVDHCHATGKFRGFLCSNCNCAIGLLKDDIGTLNKAIAYLSGIGPTCAGLE